MRVGRRQVGRRRNEAFSRPSLMIRIAISSAAFEAIAGTLPLGSVAVEPEANAKGERTVWLEEAWVDRLGAMRGRARGTATLSYVSRRSPPS
jgi:hypothetical protein